MARTGERGAGWSRKVRPLREVLPGEGCVVLDAGCGSGRKTAQLVEMGFSVVACRHDEHPPAGLPPAVRFVPGVDLNRRLPFEDGQFDAVLLSEVIEHLENLPQTIREMRRVLKPGGWWLITCPNVATAFGRLYFLATGLLPGMKYPVPLTIPPFPGDNLYMPHLWQLFYFFHHYGFEIHRLYWDRLCRRSLLLLPLLAPLILLGTAYAFGKIRDHDLLVGDIERHELPRARAMQRAGNRRLAAMYLSPKMLLSKSLVLLARKRDGSGS
jgi:SAM-dependent methyltransferase